MKTRPALLVCLALLLSMTSGQGLGQSKSKGERFGEWARQKWESAKDKAAETSVKSKAKWQETKKTAKDIKTGWRNQGARINSSTKKRKY